MKDILLFFKDKVVGAPMAGITDAPFRKIMRRFGKELLFSEMLSAESLAGGHDKTHQMSLVGSDETPVAVQLAGHRPKTMRQAVKKIADETNAVFININMGCPVRKLTSGGNGCALMKQTQEAMRLVSAAAEASDLDVTIKCRLGWSEKEENYLDFCEKMQEAGAKAVILHGRFQTQGYAGNADWTAIKRLKRILKIPVIGNGDICNAEQAQKRLNETGVDAVMIGRALLGCPWLLHNCANYVAGKKDVFIPSTDELREIVLEHLSFMENYFGTKNAVFVARKHIAWYASFRKGKASFREQVNQTSDMDDLKNLIRCFFKEEEQ